MKYDERWEAFDVPFEFESFCKRIMPEIYLKPVVHMDVHKAFRVIQKLMQFSFYEYEFYDVAASKALFTVEMAMRIRYCEITGIEWPDNKPYHKLIDWLHEEYYFDVYNESFLKNIREVRNLMAHRKEYSFGGPTMAQWFYIQLI